MKTLLLLPVALGTLIATQQRRYTSHGLGALVSHRLTMMTEFTFNAMVSKAGVVKTPTAEPAT
jgi:hypothetical protein